jgi:putative peptide zinc metalloprotease protein
MTAAAFPAARPRLRPDIVLGPGLRDGTQLVYHLKDPRTGWYFRIGAREMFVVSRLDGRSIEQIDEEYREHFNRRLDERHWHQILGLLGRRHLLVGTDDEQSIAALARSARGQRTARRGLLLYRMPLLRPDALFARLVPRVRMVFSPYLVVPALLAVVAMEVYLAAHAGELLRDMRHAAGRPSTLMLGIVVIWSTVALHEAAHGLTCKHFGGTVPEIGVIWRFPLLAPYCNADDVVLFTRRWPRVATAFAGIFAGLVAILPAWPVWAFSPAGSAVHELAGFVLLVGSGVALANLVPFLQMDGYFMLNHALGMVNLRTQTYRFWRRLAGRLVRRGAGVREYPWSARTTYLLYGMVSGLYLGSLCLRFAGFCFRTLHRWLGTAESLVLLAGLGALAVWLGMRSSRRMRDVQASATGGPEKVSPAAATTGVQPPANVDINR